MWESYKRLKVYFLFLSCMALAVNACAIRVNHGNSQRVKRSPVRVKRESPTPTPRPTTLPQSEKSKASAKLAVLPPAKAPHDTKDLDSLMQKWGDSEFNYRCCWSGWKRVSSRPTYLEEFSCEKSPKEQWSKGSITGALKFCFGRNSVLKNRTRVNEIDTIILESGEKIPLAMNDLIAKLEKLNPHITSIYDNSRLLFLSCHEALQTPKTQEPRTIKKNRDLFLEINSCVPRTKIYENYVGLQKAKELANKYETEKAIEAFSALCDNGEPEACYRAAFQVRAAGTDKLPQMVAFLKKGCDLGDKNVCDTHELWEIELAKYLKNKH